MYKNPRRFIVNLWDKSAEKTRLTFFEKIIFLILCILEKFYTLIFFTSQIIRRKNGNKIPENLKVISVGNLSVGGTGKSVFAEILVRILGKAECGIISRGYGGKQNRNESVLVGDGKNFFGAPDLCGDEPYMLAHTLHVPVVVGKDRFRSYLLMKKLFPESIKYVILDDGYQNHRLKKDFDILLVDARKPFGNGRCLPAGPLREKDYSRASVIVLTHADEVDPAQISAIKKQFCDFNQNMIFCGRHKQTGLFLFDEQLFNLEDYRDKKFLVTAGIGAFSGFVQNMKKSGVSVTQILQFPDHHIYLQDDATQIFEIVKKHSLDGVITTQKDWVKLAFLIDKKTTETPVLVSRVTFEFLTKREEDFFKKCLKSF
jgi:tetraacyldisaccharide 4'-kinase